MSLADGWRAAGVESGAQSVLVMADGNPAPLVRISVIAAALSAHLQINAASAHCRRPLRLHSNGSYHPTAPVAAGSP